MTEPRDPALPTGTPARADGDGDYSATVLASHWVQRPAPDTAPATVRATLRDDADPAAAGTRPDRTEGAVLRFGPGVQAALAHRSHATLPTAAEPARPARRRSPRRHALPALVVIAVLAFLAWQRLGPGPTVRQVTVTADPATVTCDGTADLVATVTTDGRPGTLSYRWIRSDGTSSGVLREDLVRGQTRARLHLLWTFEGKGRYEAHARFLLVSPTGPAARADLTYDCP